VEIVSPDPSVADLREKCRLYRSRGVDVCWLVHPGERWVEVFDEGKDGQRVVPPQALETPLIPGLRLAPEDIWSAIDAAPS
jgi:Uma2 family endonuclease